LLYADGTRVVLEDFYVACATANSCDLTLPGPDGAGYVLGGADASGTALGDGSMLVYAHGSQEALMGMAQGSGTLHTTLAGIGGSEITYAPAAADSGGLWWGVGGALGLAALAAGGGGSDGGSEPVVIAPVNNIVTGSVIAGP